jgi:hypothetical protein
MRLKGLLQRRFGSLGIITDSKGRKSTGAFLLAASPPPDIKSPEPHSALDLHLQSCLQKTSDEEEAGADKQTLTGNSN